MLCIMLEMMFRSALEVGEGMSLEILCDLPDSSEVHCETSSETSSFADEF